MKNLLKYYLIIIFGILLTYCDDPVETELTPDNDDLEIELLSTGTENVVLTGYDSTGVVIPAPNFSTVISLSGVQTTFNGLEFSQSLMYAAFFDKSQPVRTPQGRLIGFETRTLGRVRFQNDSATILPLVVKYRENGIIHDTLLGFQHIFYSGRRHQGQPKQFPYNSSVRFRLNLFLGNPIQFDIPTPQEISGQLRITGTKIQKNLRVELMWNALRNNRIEIVIGGILKGTNIKIPLYRLATADDGKLVIPKTLLNNIPFDKFDEIVITLIRRYRSNINTIQDHYIVSQSIHNIIVNIP